MRGYLRLGYRPIYRLWQINIGISVIGKIPPTCQPCRELMHPIRYLRESRQMDGRMLLNPISSRFMFDVWYLDISPPIPRMTILGTFVAYWWMFFFFIFYQLTFSESNHILDLVWKTSYLFDSGYHATYEVYTGCLWWIVDISAKRTAPGN